MDKVGENARRPAVLGGSVDLVGVAAGDADWGDLCGAACSVGQVRPAVLPRVRPGDGRRGRLVLADYLPWRARLLLGAGVSRAGICSTGVLKNSAGCDRAARELPGRSPSAAVGPRPASASVPSAAGGPAACSRLTVRVTAPRLSRSKMPPPLPPSISVSRTGSPKREATTAEMKHQY